MAASVMRPASTSNASSAGAGGKRYRIERTLGEGTYGKVKLAYDNYTREKVAIKIIRKENVKTKKDMERVRREIDILSVLRHPHIIKVIDVVETRTNIIIVMEYAVNGELFDYINERRYLDESESRKYFRQIVSAVDYCHKNLVVHRDLKLENLLLDKDMNIKIIDFGLSNQFNNETLLNTFCGSPLYASPEMIQGKEYHGPEVDCWSLGVVLYTLLCGTMPFDDSDMKHLVDSITNASYPHPKGLTKSALDMLSRLLRANPKKRATIENMRLHPWTNDGYSKPPMQQPLSNITNSNRRRLSSKISCLVDTPIKGMTPGNRTRSDGKINERSGIKPRTPSGRSTKSSGESNNPAAKRKLVMEPSSPKGNSMRSVQEEPELERPKSASAMLSKTPSKPPRPSRSKLDRCEMIVVPEPHQSGSCSSPRDIPSPEVSLKKSTSYDNKKMEEEESDKFKLTPDRRTLSENMSTAKFASHYDQVPDFKPPSIKDAGEITMVDSESHLFDGFGGSTRTIHQAQIDLDAHINELTNMLKDKEEEMLLTPEPAKSEKTPVPEDSEVSPPKVTPQKTTTKPAPKKQSLQLRSSLPKTPQKDTTPAARSKAAINKTGLGAKRPLGRPTSATTQRAKSAATRDRPSSVKTRTPQTKSNAANSTVAVRNRRNSDVSGSLSNLSIRSDADMSVKSTDSSSRNRVSARKISTAPSPAKRNPKVAAKVDCHRTPKKVTNSSGSDVIKEKDGVKSRITSIINKPKTPASRKPSDASVNSSAPSTPRSQKRAPKTTSPGESTPNRNSMLPRYKGTTTPNVPHRNRSNTEPHRKLSEDIKKIPFR